MIGQDEDMMYSFCIYMFAPLIVKTGFYFTFTTCRREVWWNLRYIHSVGWSVLLFWIRASVGDQIESGICVKQGGWRPNWRHLCCISMLYEGGGWPIAWKWGGCGLWQADVFQASTHYRKNMWMQSIAAILHKDVTAKISHAEDVRKSLRSSSWVKYHSYQPQQCFLAFIPCCVPMGGILCVWNISISIYFVGHHASSDINEWKYK